MKKYDLASCKKNLWKNNYGKINRNVKKIKS